MVAFSEQANKNSSTSENYLLVFRLSAYYEEPHYHNGELYYKDTIN